MLRTLEEVLAVAKALEPCTIAVAAAQDKDVLTAVYAAAEQGKAPVMPSSRFLACYRYEM